MARCAYGRSNNQLMRDAMTVILRDAMPAYTLDDALLSMSTFYNGCDYRLRFEGKRTFVEFGCYGVHRNLETGDRRRFMERIEENGGEIEFFDVKPETLVELKSRKPCARCGGFTFKE
jgi:hypothetical protein